MILNLLAKKDQNIIIIALEILTLKVIIQSKTIGSFLEKQLGGMYKKMEI